MIRRYFKNAGLLAAAEGLLQLKGLIVIPFLTRHFGPINYGVWSQISVLIGTITPLVILGTDSAAMRLMPGLDISKQKRYFSAWISFLFIVAIFFALPVLLLKNQIAEIIFGETDEYVQFLSLAAAWLVVGALVTSSKRWFLIQGTAKWLVAINILQSTLDVFAVAAMLILGKGAYQLILYSLYADIVLFAVVMIVIAKQYGLERPDFSILSPLIRFGVPLVPAGFAIWALNYSDRFFLAKYSNLEEIGVYAVAYGLANRVVPLSIKPWWTMFYTSAAELYNLGKHDVLQRLFERSAGLSFALAVPASVGFFLLGKRLLNLIATPAFIGGVPVLFFISIGYTFLVINSFYETALGLKHKQFISTWIYLTALGLNLVLNFLLIPKFTIVGAAIATCLSFLSMLLLSLYFSARFKMFHTPIDYVVKVIGSSVVMGVGIYLSDIYFIQWLGSPIIEIFLLMGFGLLTYLACLWCVGIVNRRELELGFGLLRGK